MLQREPFSQRWKFKYHPKGWTSFSEHDGGNVLDVTGSWIVNYRSEYRGHNFNEDWDRVVTWEIIRAVCYACCKGQLPKYLIFARDEYKPRVMRVFWERRDKTGHVSEELFFEFHIVNTTKTCDTTFFHYRIPGWTKGFILIQGLDCIPKISVLVEKHLRECTVRYKP